MQLIGLVRLGRDAELRHTANGDAVLQMAMAYNYGKKADKLTQWIDASMWGERAEKLAPYMLKGTALCVTLSDVHVHLYAKSDGTQAASIRAKVSDVEFASKPEGSAKNAAPKPTPKPEREPGEDDAPW